MSQALPTSLDADYFTGLYRKYAGDLTRVRAAQAELYQSFGYLPVKDAPLPQKLLASARRAQSYLTRGAILKPQLDDIEAELTYLWLRESRPRTVVEISPCGGWSSTWILHALADNRQGELYSFDMIDASERNVPRELAQGRRHFFLGRVQDNLDHLPTEIDYAFIDSDHSAKFAHWYIENIFSRLKPGTPVSVHDVFHTPDPAGFDSEGGVVISWLDDNRIPYFTASPTRAPGAHRPVSETKRTLKLDAKIHRAENNSMIFFRR
ncbi:MAG: class I SAM-dependent methyltransferase [Bacteriovoracia bacterium]